MDIIIKQTGETKHLSYIWPDTGIDCARDFVGNANGIKETNDDGTPIMDADDYEWWIKTVAAHQAMEAEIKEYRQKYGDDAVDQALDGALDCDLEDMPACAHHYLTQCFD